MKNRILSLLLFSTLMTATVYASEASIADDTQIDGPETRVVTIDIHSEKTIFDRDDSTETIETENTDTLSENIENTNDETVPSETIEITETKYMDESGFSLWYNAESLKPAEYGGQLCFIPVDEEEALKASSVIIIVSNEPGETPSPLNEVTGMYPPENVSELKEISLESGITFQTQEVKDEGTINDFYIVSFEDLSLNITSMMAEEDLAAYESEFERLVESISFN